MKEDHMNDVSRRGFVSTSLGTALAGWLGSSQAQMEQTGKLLVGYPAGGSLDVTARQLAEAWRKRGRLFIVDNRAGAGGRIANSMLKKERADGNTLLVTHNSALTIYPFVYKRQMYDVIADFMPVSPIVSATLAFAVSSAVPAERVKTLDDYVSWVRANPGASSYASPAAGSSAHLLGFQLSQSYSLNLQHVPYRGSAPAMQDLLGGQVPAYFGQVPDFIPYLQKGSIRVLGVAGEKRSRFMPGIPTFAEQGQPSLRHAEVYGVFAPPGTPDATIKKLHSAVVEASADAQLRSAFDQLGLEVVTSTPGQYAAALRQERDSWEPVVRASGFHLED
jgi:tripartite-type tricarboxylate transporter receptor subunit TctC